MSLIAYVVTFFRTTVFLEKPLLQIFSEELLQHNSYFFAAAISSEQLHFSRELFFKKSRFFAVVIFFRIATFLEQNLYRAASSSEWLILQDSYFVGTATFWMKEFVQNKDIYRTAIFLKQVLLHSNHFFRTDSFSTKVLFQSRYFFTQRYNFCIIILLLLVQYFMSMFFRTVTFWKKLIFQKSNIPHYLLFLESHFFRVG